MLVDVEIQVLVDVEIQVEVVVMVGMVCCAWCFVLQVWSELWCDVVF